MEYSGTLNITETIFITNSYSILHSGRLLITVLCLANKISMNAANCVSKYVHIYKSLYLSRCVVYHVTFLPVSLLKKRMAHNLWKCCYKTKEPVTADGLYIFLMKMNKYSTILLVFNFQDLSVLELKSCNSFCSVPGLLISAHFFFLRLFPIALFLKK